MQPMAHKSEALLEPRDVKISGETYSGVPTKELRFGLGGEQPASSSPESSLSSNSSSSESTEKKETSLVILFKIHMYLS